MMSDKLRCRWAVDTDTLCEHYHDTEWGVPVHDERKLFEFLVLEGAQAGLSWITILRRRQEYFRVFSGFDPKKVAKFDERIQDDILRNSGIIRNKRKVFSAIENARRFLDIQEEYGSFDAFLWGFVGGEPLVNAWRSFNEVPERTKESKELSKALKERGFSFVGPTIMYAYMQAIGMVNDHTTDCFRHKELSR